MIDQNHRRGFSGKLMAGWVQERKKIGTTERDREAGLEIRGSTEEKRHTLALSFSILYTC